MPRPSLVTLGAPEWIADIPLAAMAQARVQLPTQGGQIPNDRFMAGLRIWFEGRCTNAAANNPTGVTADNIFALIDTIIIQGTHRIRGRQEQFINVRGPDIREWCGYYRMGFPFAANIPNGGAELFASGPGATTLGGTNTAAGAMLDLAANHTNDIKFCIEVPFFALACQTGQQIDTLLDAPNYDNLTLSIAVGDDLSVFTYAAHGAPVWSAYNSALGNPRIRVEGVFAKQGRDAFRGFVPARPFRWFQEITGSPLTTTATGVRLLNINRGNKIRGVLLKTGTRSAAATAGFNTYATRSDLILSGNIQWMQGTNRQIRFAQDYRHLAEQAKAAYASYGDQGYALIDFATHGSLKESLNLRGAVVGASGDVDTYLQSDVTGAANQALLALYEELYYDPSQGGVPYQSF